MKKDVVHLSYYYNKKLNDKLEISYDDGKTLYSYNYINIFYS